LLQVSDAAQAKQTQALIHPVAHEEQLLHRVQQGAARVTMTGLDQGLDIVDQAIGRGLDPPMQGVEQDL
jgi:hypothetical protein